MKNKMFMGSGKKIIISVVTVSIACIPLLAQADTATTTDFSGWQGLQFPQGYQDPQGSSNATPIVSDSGMFGLQFATGTQSADGSLMSGYAAGPRLIKLEGSSTVYWVNENNLKLPMLSQKVFLSYHNKDSDVSTVSQDEMDYYQTAQYIQVGTGTVYKISGTTKQPISSAAWESAGIADTQIVKINTTELASYKTGAKITTAENLQ